MIAESIRALARPISELVEDPANVRRHPRRNLDAIAASLQRFGQQLPVVVAEGRVIAGNGTLAAARALGWDELATVEFDSADEHVHRAYAIADNRTAELAEWDAEVLGLTMQSLEGVASWTELGFSDAEIRRLAPRAPESFDMVAAGSEDFEHDCPRCGFSWSGAKRP